jgi:hydrogenase maturation protease
MTALARQTATIRVVGCGRSHRRDDQLGLRVAERLAGSGMAGVAVSTSEAPGADILTDLEGCELLIIVDAVEQCPRLRPGEWRRIDYDHSPDARIVAGRMADPEPSHFLGVNTALALGRELGLLPPEVWVYALAGRDFGYGDALSPGLDEAVLRLSDRIGRDIEEWQRDRSRCHA